MQIEHAVRYIESNYGPASKVLSRLIRPAIVADEGCTYVWGDWSAVEARGLPWLAGAPGEVVLDVFRQNDADPSAPDIYMVEAGGIFGKDAGDIDRASERPIGKVAVLALGFGGGESALDSMASGYGINLEDELRAHVVRSWRSKNDWATDFWSQLISAFHRAMERPEEVFEVGRVSFVYLPDYLFGSVLCFLPCGRPIHFSSVRREKVEIEDEDTGETSTEWRIRYQSGYERKSLWHGIIAENITQGMCASLMRDLLVRLEGLPGSDRIYTKAHTHDECVQQALLRDEEYAKRRLKAAMETVPDWAAGLPLAAEVVSSWYYTKTAG